MTIRPAQASDETAWREMWLAYCTFYGQTLPESVTASVWARSRDGVSLINTVIAHDENGVPLGFANYVLHPHTWSDKTLCYLEDLYVRPEARGRNVGHALIEHLIETGKSLGWARVYWHTETGNAAARRLYDRFKPADDFVRYTVPL
ncbi:MAG: GNAT family N-acetyltransferase [Fibrella sp.]|nr:GNAT family N-acetyltransferase [Armatimonadota bacterium]